AKISRMTHPRAIRGRKRFTRCIVSPLAARGVDTTGFPAYTPALPATDHFPPPTLFSVPGADREADLSAVATRAQAPSRLPFADGHQERTKDRSAPPRQGPQAPDGLGRPAPGTGRMSDLVKIERLKSRPQFLAAAKGVSE